MPSSVGLGYCARVVAPRIAPLPTYGKRSGHWRVSVMRDGTRHRATFTTKAEAEFWAEGLVRGTSGKVTLSDALKRYSAEVSPTKRGARWEQIRIEAFLRILPFVDRPIERVASGDLADWRGARLKQVSGGTVGREEIFCPEGFRFVVGSRYIVFAAGSPLQTSACEHTGLVNDAETKTTLQWLSKRSRKKIVS